MSIPIFDIDEQKFELINLINQIQEQFNIEWLHLNFKYIAEYQQQNQEYQQIIKDVFIIFFCTFDEDQNDLMEDEYLEKNKIKQISDKLQQQDLKDYLLFQFEILKKQINKYFFQIYSDPQFNIQIKEKYKILLIEGTKDFLFLIFIQTAIITNNKFQRCRLIIITYNQKDFSIFNRFEIDINYKIYTAKIICNHQLNQIALYTNEILCLYDVNNQVLVQYVLNQSQNVLIFYHETILQIENSIYLNKLIYQNQVFTSNRISLINSYKKPYQLLLYYDYLIIYFEKIVSIIYCKNGKSLQIKRNLTNLPDNSEKESCISNNSKLIYQLVHKDKFHSFIYQFSLLNGKIIRKIRNLETSQSTHIYLIKFDKLLVSISQDYIEVYSSILAKQLLYLHIKNQMRSSESLLKIINSKFLVNFDYNKLSIWKQNLNDMNFLINKLKTADIH